MWFVIHKWMFFFYVRYIQSTGFAFRCKDARKWDFHNKIHFTCPKSRISHSFAQHKVVFLFRLWNELLARIASEEKRTSSPPPPRFSFTCFFCLPYMCTCSVCPDNVTPSWTATCPSCIPKIFCGEYLRESNWIPRRVRASMLSKARIWCLKYDELYVKLSELKIKLQIFAVLLFEQISA